MHNAISRSSQQEGEQSFVLRLRQVLQITSYSRSAWLAGVKVGRFPRPARLGPRTVAWRRSDIEALCARLADGGTDQ